MTNPAIHIKSEFEIIKMRLAGTFMAQLLDMITPHVQPGVTSNELDKLCYEYILNMYDLQGVRGIPYLLGYHGVFPKSIFTSLNEVSYAGTPDDRPLEKGDIFGVDIVFKLGNYFADGAKMFVVGGKTTPEHQKLVDVGYEAMWRGIREVRPGAHIGNIGHAIQTYVEENGFSVVKAVMGHGIGLVHQEDSLRIPHYGERNTGVVMEPGMIFNIEPIISPGDGYVTYVPGSLAAVIEDGSSSAHWEHTVLVTESGYEVMTLRADEKNMSISG